MSRCGASYTRGSAAHPSHRQKHSIIASFRNGSLLCLVAADDPFDDGIVTVCHPSSRRGPTFLLFPCFAGQKGLVKLPSALFSHAQMPSNSKIEQRRRSSPSAERSDLLLTGACKPGARVQRGLHVAVESPANLRSSQLPCQRGVFPCRMVRLSLAC